MWRNPDLWYRCALIILALLLWVPRLHGPIDLRYDGGVYYLSGVALAEGQGYRLSNEPGEIQAVQYPPLLPAFVAAHRLVVGTGDPAVLGRALRLSYCVLFLLFLLAAYELARQYLPPTAAFLVGAITALNFQVLYLSNLLFAEIPFGLAALVFALANRRSDRAPYFLLAAVAGAAAYLLRTAGTALLAAWVLESLIRKRWKQAALRAAVALLPVAGWQAYVTHVTAGAEYTHPVYAYQRADYQYSNVTYAANLRLCDPFAPESGYMSPRKWAGRLLGNLAEMPAGLGDGVTHGEDLWLKLREFAVRRGYLISLRPWMVTAPNLLVGGAVLAGMALLLARREWFIPLYIAGSTAMIYLTPWPKQYDRYLAPVTPFLTICLMQALVALRAYSLRHWSPQWSAASWAATALLLAGVLGTEAGTDLYVFAERTRTAAGPGGCGEGSMFYYDKPWADYDAALAWLRESAGPDEVLVTTWPHWAYLKTGRKAVLVPMEADRAKTQELLEDPQLRVGYVIVDQTDELDVIQRYIDPTIRDHPKRWRLVHTVSGSDTRVYRLVPLSEAEAPNTLPERGTK